MEGSAVQCGTDVVLRGMTALVFVVWEILNIAPRSLIWCFLYLGYWLFDLLHYLVSNDKYLLSPCYLLVLDHIPN